MNILPVEEATLPPDSWRENVAAIVVDAAGRVLLGLGNGPNAYWHFPQGGIASRETAEEALHRELMEEVGLEPHRYRILARYGGLRYRYRKNNDKSGRWRGQEQTYFFVLCHGEMPLVDCVQTDEFCALTWVPWQELTTDLFAPVKRKVVARVLTHFFPSHLAEDELIPYVENGLTPARYCAAAVRPADETILFAGGKEEMVAALHRLELRVRAAHKAMAAAGGRLVVLVHGTPGSGRKQCLRRLATLFDPLALRVAEADALTFGLPWELLALLPPAGGVALVLQRPEREMTEVDEGLFLWMAGQGVHVLPLCLHGGDETPLPTLSAAWYTIPSARRWYRDYVVSLLVAEALESSACAAPLLASV